MSAPGVVVTDVLAVGAHPDHGAVTDLVVGAVFYARLPKWGQVQGGERLEKTEPHEIDRLLVEDPTVFRPVRYG